MIRVLHSVSNMDRAGIETMLMNYYRHIDKTKVQFDFLCNKTKPGAYDSEIKKLGGNIYITPGLNPLKYNQYLRYMKQLFSAHPEYQIVHAHNGALGVYALHAAKVNNIPIRIFHAHGASINKDWKMPLKLFCKNRLKYNTNHKWTCGVEAARCYYGEDTVEKEEYLLIRNAIEVERFIFNNHLRCKLRKQYHLENKHVIGHVGRFMSQKNHIFLINLLYELCKTDKDIMLVLAGDGELMQEVKQHVEKLNLNNCVIFLGNVSKINELYQMFDVFILPSIWEGLPVVGIEAQAAGLPCVFSSNVTKEVAITDDCHFISLDAPMENWVNLVSSLYKTERKNNMTIITNAGYNIIIEAEKLQNKYIELAKELL